SKQTNGPTPLSVRRYSWPPGSGAVQRVYRVRRAGAHHAGDFDVQSAWTPVRLSLSGAVLDGAGVARWEMKGHCRAVIAGNARRTTMTSPMVWQTALVFALALVSHMAGTESEAPNQAAKVKQWRALHLLGYNTDQDLEKLSSQIPKLAKMGLNVLILEVDFHFRFESYPKLRDGKEPITPEGAGKIAAVC